MKARLETDYGEWVERIPAWTKWATQVCKGRYFSLRPPAV